MILIYGFYGKGNLGDELFKRAFESMFPQLNLKFVSSLTESDVQNAPLIIFGGGSFLGGKILGTSQAIALLEKKVIFYIGVGVESFIDPSHMQLLPKAKLIATRSLDQISRLKSINENVVFIPDLVYSLQSVYTSKRSRILYIPNFLVTPKNKDPHWKHASWGYFKSEFSQFLDILVENKHSIDVLGMCSNQEGSDKFAAIEIVNGMSHPSKIGFVDADVNSVDQLVSSYNFVITQRFHGIILAQMTGTPYLALSHHDKLLHAEPMQGRCLSYYGLTKNQLLNVFDQRDQQNINHTFNQEQYFQIAQKVLEALI